MQTAYWPAHEARRDAAPGQAAAALGLDESGARTLLARFGHWSPYRRPAADPSRCPPTARSICRATRSLHARRD